MPLTRISFEVVQRMLEVRLSGVSLTTVLPRHQEEPPADEGFCRLAAVSLDPVTRIKADREPDGVLITGVIDVHVGPDAVDAATTGYARALEQAADEIAALFDECRVTDAATGTAITFDRASFAPDDADGRGGRARARQSGTVTISGVAQVGPAPTLVTAEFAEPQTLTLTFDLAMDAAAEGASIPAGSLVVHHDQADFNEWDIDTVSGAVVTLTATGFDALDGTADTLDWDGGVELTSASGTPWGAVEGATVTEPS